MCETARLQVQAAGHLGRGLPGFQGTAQEQEKYIVFRSVARDRNPRQTAARMTDGATNNVGHKGTGTFFDFRAFWYDMTKRVEK